MTSSLLRKTSTFIFSKSGFPIFLLGLCLIAYAPLINRLGYYWDDFPISWIAATMGGEGLDRYFSTNRPVWGMIYRVTTPLLGSTPLNWQIFGLLMRWATGLALWALLRQVWREREHFAAWAASLFVVYPGFSQQPTAFMYSHFYIVLTCLLLSMLLMVLAQRHPRYYWPLTAGAALLGLLNLLAMEYFFLLDLLRPVLLWVVLSETIPNRRRRLRQTLLAWLPYLAIFAGAMFWRSVLFGFHTYQPTLVSQLKVQPLQTLLALLVISFQDVWKTSAGAWVKIFTFPTAMELGERKLQVYWLVTIAGILYAAGYWLLYRSADRPKKQNLAFQWWAWQPAAVGMLALFIAGGPFWLTSLPISLVFPNDRFTLPFMLGVSLAAAALLASLPLPRWSQAALLAVALGFASGLHFQSAVAYSQDWSLQRSLFWQMTWRMPDLEPGTVLLANELPIQHYSDNSLTAPLNWIYDPQNNPRIMKYILYYPTVRQARDLGNFQPGQAIERDYLAATFFGSTSQMVTIFYNPPGCLRVLDPEIETANWMVPDYLRETLSLSTMQPILPVSSPGKPLPYPPAHIYGSEIAHGWCYYYEKADLARQLGDWDEVAALGDQAFTSGDYPNDPVERFPFIEGYAHTGNWSRALELSREAQNISPVVMQPMLCRLWERIERETMPGSSQSETIEAARAELECGTSYNEP